MAKQKIRSRKLAIVGWTLACLFVGFGMATVLGSTSTLVAQTGAQQTPAPPSFTHLAKQASPSVVNISTVKVVKGRGQFPMPFGPDDPFKDFFDRFFRDQIPKDFRQQSLGTGFIIDKEGYILTNNHVVEKADEIKVKLADDQEVMAKIVGRDPKTDLALIKIEADKDFIPLPLGDSDKLEVGEWVVAIVRAAGDQTWLVSVDDGATWTEVHRTAYIGAADYTAVCYGGGRFHSPVMKEILGGGLAYDWVSLRAGE